MCALHGMDAESYGETRGNFMNGMPNPMANFAMNFSRTDKKFILHWHADTHVMSLLEIFYRPFLRKFIQKSEGVLAGSRTSGTGRTLPHPRKLRTSSTEARLVY